MLNAQSQCIDMNEGETEIEELEQSDTQATQAPRKRRLTSTVWNGFVSVGTVKTPKEHQKFKSGCKKWILTQAIRFHFWLIFITFYSLEASD